MTYDVYRSIFIGAAILSGIMFIVSVFVFILLKIPRVVSDLSGATARKAIKNIREQNEASGDKAYKVSAFNEARGKLTDKISLSGNLVQQYQAQMRGIDTTKIGTQDLQGEILSNETTVLNAYNETTLSDNTGVGEIAFATNSISMNETTVLGGTVNDLAFAIEYEITFIHTNEIIAMEVV